MRGHTIVTIFILIVVDVTANKEKAKSAITFDEIWTLRPRSFSGLWINDGHQPNQLLFKGNGGHLVLHNFDTNTTKDAVKYEVIKNNSVNNYYPSYDARYFLMSYGHKKVWRYSFLANYFIYDTKTRQRIKFPFDGREGKLQYAAWAGRGYSIVFVQGNDLYYQSGLETIPRPVTSDGDDDMLRVFNGITNWLYEEDVLYSQSATYFSEDGNFMIFGCFNDTNVPLAEYPLYLPTSDAYARRYRATYPMAGNVVNGTAGPNTQVTLHLVDLTQTTFVKTRISPPPQISGRDHYYTRVAFIDNKTATITWTNRVQNEAYVQMCFLRSAGNSAPIAECIVNQELVINDGWIDVPWPAPIPDLADKDNPAYFTYYMNPESEGRFKHLARVTISPDGLGTEKFLTSGKHEVQSILAFDASRRYMYFYSNNGVQRQRHLMRLEFGKNDNNQTCITCQLQGCTYASAKFSATADYFLLSCLGPDIPRYQIMNHQLRIVQVMEDNAKFRQKIETKDKPTREDMELDIGNNIIVNAAVFHPPNLQRGARYPLFVNVYAGPGSLQITDRYEYGGRLSNWMRYLGSTHNIAVAMVDGRGTYGRGEDWKFKIYKNLANVEVEDQIAAGRKLVEALGYVNNDENAAIFGWSYGGFAASHVLGRNDSFYQCAIAVAALTSMRYYDTAYTERYMGLATPEDNAAGYEKTDLFPLAPNFKDKHYFIAHGTNDNNVLFRHYATFVRALINAGVHFTQQTYIDEEHAIISAYQSRHIIQSMTQFLTNDCYKFGYQPPTKAPPPPNTLPSYATKPRSASPILTVALLALIRAIFT